ncbi:uncharacterized protein LOC130725553 [Lotus japonicus]|uniref:uncharacterized protein LOC130725553 n=1 Tax=Lotus japonicus TaxID=34305 RepID=UPI00259080D9|nr:uncharacterized protein LOC130725553 [Lotus japonicus]
MDPNNYHFNTQNSSNYPYNYQNSNNYQDPNQFFNPRPQNPNNYQDPNQFSNPRPQNIHNFGFAPNLNQSSFHPSYGSMRYPSQTPPFSGYMPMVNENFSSVDAPEFPEFSTQMTLGGMTAANQVTSNQEDSTPKRKKILSPTWNTAQNLVLISGWIKCGTRSVVGKNQKGETFWRDIAEYCKEHCSFDPPRDGVACRNRWNYMNKILGKWIGAKRSQGSGWLENDVLAKDQFLVQWVGRQLKKRVKKKSREAALEEVDKDWAEFKQFKEKELERLEKITSVQQETNQLMKDKTHTKKINLYLKLSSEEHLDDRKKELLKKLSQELLLQARFKIIREPARLWDITDLGIILRSCIILHNIIVEDERDSYAQRWTDFEQSGEGGSSTPQPYSTELRDPNVHHELQADLVKHIWAKFGNVS